MKDVEAGNEEREKERERERERKTDRQAIGAGGIKRVRGSKRDCKRVMRTGRVKVSE